MEWKVPLSNLDIGESEKNAVMRVLDSGWLSLGAETERFERAFAHYIGCDFAVATSSGTAALHLVLKAVGVGPGDEVILPSLTFVAGLNMVLHLGAAPVFADVTSLDDPTISPDEVRRRVSPRTKALMIMHYAGFPCDMEPLMSIAGNAGVPLIEDAAHAPGASFCGKRMGSWGAAGCFSFFSNKNLAVGEGGMVTTNNHVIAEKVCALRSHGMTSGTWDRHRGHSFLYDVRSEGFNYRIDEMRSALGAARLEQLDEHNRRRRRISRTLRDALAEMGALSIPFRKADPDESACHIFPVILDSRVDRASFMALLKDRGVQTSVHYPPTHRFSTFRDRFSVELPITEAFSAREVTLPLFPGMTDEDTEAVVSAVREGLNAHRNVRT
jgi:dTDP-4-amino-4,6-dideoxygalactose transaminase